MPDIDLSYEAPDYSSGPVSPSQEQKTKRCYPTLSIPNNLALAKSLSAGQEFTATIKCRVSEVMIRERADTEKSDMGCYPGEGVRVEMEVQSLTPNGITVKQGSDEEDGSSAMKKFFNKKKSDADMDYDQSGDDDSDSD